MQYHFSERMLTIQPSAVREIFKLTNAPDMISFSAGNPSPDTFPIDALRQVTENLISDKAAFSKMLQYGISEGYNPMIDVTAKRMKEKFNMMGEDDKLIITSGGQQGIDLFCKAVVDAGDAVIVEAPSFVGSLNTFRTYGAQLIPVPMQPDGMDLDLLEKALKENPRVRFIYCIATFQNPSGYTTSLEKRKAMLELARKYDVLILEDGPYNELRFSGEHVPTIKSLDTEGRVIFSGSYSKVISPGVRLGFLIAGNELMQKIVIGKQATDVHTNLFMQAIASEFLSKYDLDAHIAKACALYKHKAELMLKCIDAEMPKEIVFSRPEGGLFLWGVLPEGKDSAELFNMGVEKKVAVVPGRAFMVDDRAPCNGFRLNYSMPTDEQIVNGISILAGCVKEFLKK